MAHGCQRGSVPVVIVWSHPWRVHSLPSFSSSCLVPKPCLNPAYRAAPLGGGTLAAYRSPKAIGPHGEFGLPGYWWLRDTVRLTRRCNGWSASRPIAEQQNR